MRKVTFGCLIIAAILLPSIFYVLPSDRPNVASAAYLFQDGFESGNTSAWTKITSDTTATCKVTNLASKEGVYSLNTATTVANSFSYISKTLSFAKASLYFNWSVYFSSIPRLDSDRLTFVRIRNAADQTLLTVDLNWHSGTGLRQRLLMYQPNVSNEVASNVTVGRWYWFQINYTVDSVGGGADFWINGVKTNSLSHLNNTGLGQPLKVQVGICYGTGNNFGAYVDCCAIDGSYIASTPVSSPGFLLLKAQFHIHTNFSDGEYTPEQVVDKYKNAGYDVIAITDHSTTDGCARAKAEGDRVGLIVISGEEITNTFPDGTDQHILGFFLQATIPSAHNVSDPKPFFDQIHAQNGVGCVAHPWVLYASNWTTEFNFTLQRWYPFVGQSWIDGWAVGPKNQLEPQSTYDTILGDGYYIEFDHDFHYSSEIHKLAEYWTVVESYNNTESGIKDALLHQRTVCYDTGTLWGTPNAISIYIALTPQPIDRSNDTYPPITASYIVDIQGGYTCMFNGSDDRAGKLEYYSTDQSKVLNFAFGNTTNGGLVFVRAGLYNLNARLYVTHSITVMGEGESTCFRVVDNCGWPINSIDIFVQADDVHLLNFKLDGNSAGNPSPPTGGYDGIVTTVGIKGLTVQWCTITNCAAGEGVKMMGAQRCIVTGNTFIDNGGDSVGVDGSENNTISNNFLIGAASEGVDIDSSNFTLVLGNQILDDKGTGIFIRHSACNNEIRGNYIIGSKNYGIELMDTQTHSNTIAGNYIIRNGPAKGMGIWDYKTGGNNDITDNTVADCATGIQTYAVSNDEVDGNTVRNCQQSGICLYNTSDSSLIGNHVTECSTSQNHAYPNIRLDGISCYNFIQGNFLRTGNQENKSSYGIRIYAGSNYNYVIDNDVYNSGVLGNIYDQGSHNSIQANRGYATEAGGTITFSGTGTQKTFSIPHGLVGTPTSFIITPNSIDCGINYYVTANVTHININYVAPLSGLKSTASGWGTAPTDLANCVDGNYTTSAGTGNTNSSAAYAVLGSLTWNLGAVYTSTYTAKLGIWHNASGLVAYWSYSTDGSTYTRVDDYYQLLVDSAATESIRFTTPKAITAQYIRLEFTSTGAPIAFYVNVYEVTALGQTAPPPGTNNLSFSWSAEVR